MPNPVLVIASELELPLTCQIWGGGEWRDPKDREALDWLTFARLLGWGVSVAQLPQLPPQIESTGLRWILVACDPGSLTEEHVEWLTAVLEQEEVLIVARAGTLDQPLARLTGVAQAARCVTGRALSWIGPGAASQWVCRRALEGDGLQFSERCSTWARLEGVPVIVARRVGRGTIATLGFHPSDARDRDGAATALLRHLLIQGIDGPVAWFDLEGTLVLRMDDPGGAQNVHSEQWCYPKLTEREWDVVGAELARRKARLSIGYVAGWVDDGDPARGILEVGSQMVPRVPGEILPSPQVRYWDIGGHRPGTLHDYESEYRGIQSLRAAGLVEVELHGFTHMHPDTAVWVSAPDRYRGAPETYWYRELGAAATDAIRARFPEDHPLALGVGAIREHFGITPTTLICPGEQWTDEVLVRALELKLNLIGSYYLAVRDANRFCWCTHVCAPYLDQPDAAWFDAGLPVVGYFHDYDLAHEGVSWLEKWLGAWYAAGARRFIDYRELAGVIGRRLWTFERDGEVRIDVGSEGAPDLVRPASIRLRYPVKGTFSRVSVSHQNSEWTIQTQVSPGQTASIQIS